MIGQRINAVENRTEVMVDFRVNAVRIDSAYSHNAERVQEIISFLKNLNSDSTTTISSVSFCGAASPEGSYALNTCLAKGRLSALETLVRSKVAIPDSIVRRDEGYIPWEYLREQVAKSDLPYRDTVISILDQEPALVKDHDNGKLVDRRIVRIKQLNHRRVWNELFRRYFSKMRNASAVIITEKADTINNIGCLPPPYPLPRA